MTIGEALTRWSVRMALVLSVAGFASLLLGRRGPARWVWTLGCLAFLLHVAAAFHFYHGWDHTAALAATARETEAVTGLAWGGGLYLNYLFTSLWVADVLWWWLAPTSHARRPREVTAAWHGFFAFLAFNATVVFESGLPRWLGLLGCAGLLALAWATRTLRENAP